MVCKLLKVNFCFSQGIMILCSVLLFLVVVCNNWVFFLNLILCKMIVFVVVVWSGEGGEIKGESLILVFCGVSNVFGVVCCILLLIVFVLGIFIIWGVEIVCE